MYEISPVSQTSKELLPVKTGLLGVISSLHSLDSLSLVCFVKELGCARGVGEEQEDNDGKKYSWGAFDDELEDVSIMSFVSLSHSQAISKVQYHY